MARRNYDLTDVSGSYSSSVSMLALPHLKNIATIRDVNRHEWYARYQLYLDMIECNTAWDNHVQDVIKERYNSNRDRMLAFLTHVNVAKKIVHTLAKAYSQPPTRTLLDVKGEEVPETEVVEETGEETPNESVALFEDFLDSIGLDRRMLHAERQAELCESCFIHFNPSFGGKTFDVEILDTPSVMVQLSDMDGSTERAKRILVPIAQNPDSIGMPTEQLWISYALDNGRLDVWIVDGNLKEVPEDKHKIDLAPWRMMDEYPIVLLQPDQPQHEDLFRDLDRSIYTTQLQMTDFMTQMEKRRCTAGFEPLNGEMTNKDFTKSNPELSAWDDSVAILGGELSRIEFNPKYDQYKLWIQTFLQTYGKSVGLPLSFSDPIVNQSGIAKFYELQPTREHWEERRSYYAGLDPVVVRKALKMAKVVKHDAGRLAGYSCQSAFHEMKASLAPEEQARVDEANMRMNLDSPLWILQRRFGMTEEEAKEQLQKNREANNMFGSSSSPFETAGSEEGPQANGDLLSALEEGEEEEENAR